MDLNEQGWMLALGAGLLLLSKGLRRLIASALQWVALAAFLYGVYQSITAPFERGITELITWTLIACACAVFARFLTPRPTLEPPNPFCGTCRGSRWISCDHALQRMTGAPSCLECGGVGQKPCPRC